MCLIRFKSVTIIGSGKFTRYLDEQFGCEYIEPMITPWWTYLIVVIIYVCVLALLFLWVKRKNSEAKNIKILQLCLTLLFIFFIF